MITGTPDEQQALKLQILRNCTSPYVHEYIKETATFDAVTAVLQNLYENPKRTRSKIDTPTLSADENIIH